ncbi:hybrid sensor histidine kinase/response regulator [Stutzerimonas nosocomialis]|uniref:histidine kinase n=1 Tax=Stutzerimonas nosocomialis TaxID=1056496 RepID=A0A5R9QGI4_9GAMM|nr:PAS domain-containing sensor histidine kinase [Stutzerimonas nosocomialis]TLX64307.1 hybrid sensor histidine kinase/response regulator [Stutzerimonas nosocomialis]
MQQSPSFESLFRLSPNAYVLLDPERVILDANAAYVRLTGRTLDEIRGHRLPEAFAAGHEQAGSVHPQALLDSFARVLERKETDSLSQVRYPVRDAGQGAAGEGRPWRVTHTPIMDEQGKVTAVLQHVAQEPHGEAELAGHRQQLEALVNERTRELERSEAERQAVEAALFQAQKLEAVGKLTGGIAHDFNNMLQIIGGNLQLLRRNLSGDATALRRLDSAVSGVEKGARLASQLLAFASRQPLQPQTIHLGELVPRMLELLHGSLGQATEVEVDIDPAAWPVFADVSNLETVILNLAVNARDAMGAGGRLLIGVHNQRIEPGSLEFPEAAPGDYVRLQMTDFGPGMETEVQARAFEPFFTTKQASNASGLGLSMVYGFVKQSGGFVTLQSEVGKGTTVVVLLPRGEGEAAAPAETAPAQVAAPAPAAPEDEMPASGLKVLFVEDDPTLRMLTGEVMMELGHEVSLSESAEDALARLENERFDVLFTDVGLAGMSGIELVRKVQERYPQLSVVIASGYAVDPRQEGLKPLHTMLKPYDIHRVRDMLAGIQATLRP